MYEGKRWQKLRQSVCACLSRYTPSQGDVVVFEAVGSRPSAKFVNALRWFNHIASYSADMLLA